MNTLRAPLLLACLLLVTACGQLTGPQSRTFRGQFVWAFEASAFTPCGGTEAWWVSFASEAVAQEVSARVPWPIELGAPVQPVYVEWRAERSGRGEYGHMGAYGREIRVTEVLEVRTWTPESCR
jgi:hypothetical protein